ncbi:MAG: Leucine-tRNA ligase [Candidatus Collierbacteria bacterium GW2011_GWB1_44_6]|uniref:Leucine--tRNA ligase n=2 Tax=Candidatus Collieribacteriota TaxID=1752725 RepID=A0A0G1JLI4_9BACT|nr:MAG: Leucine-tRNA ligase [Candidatus Collierbacteria bacterium GW2011_GWC2_43_12]KKT72243.1 MAG: Leucine-tRNA ligase [Candidatus Collierbacteria bacterium GW2011_GWB1_44_6]KKT82529.1 MAG: leucyl-tRNA synthetase, leucyl-tRNA synthetase [Microgenomates group bacterium GW2011_GWC1_44_9]
MAYDFKEIEKKWIPQYEEFDGYKGIDFENDKEKFYMLTEFPYPSGSGLHVGHAFAMTAADVYARFQRMQGKNVMFPMGWDAFGLPAENYAIKTGRNPKEITKEVTDMFRSQMKKLGFSFDWDREINSTSPDYYKWTQWIFTKLFEEGLAEKKEMPINWCPKDKIGLANEEVIDGKCERCGTEVEKRTISQWVVKITDYADRLINGLYDTEFIEKVKAAQINWIGKKEGAKIRFEVKGHPEKLEVFTTRPDTIAGATFMVIAPEHALVGELLEGHSDNVSRVKEYLENIKGESEMQRTDASREKTGVFSGLIAINPITNKEIPIWIADYVTMSYGTGAIMAVPSHDDRDGEFAQKFGLEINETYTPDDQMMEEIEKRGMGEKAVTYHLRDWIFSRQHYWGEPIPMVYCERDGWVSVPAVDLPVVLPDVEKYLPTDTGESPLANIKDWVETTCPKCGGKAKRETDTMPNWAGSDWYFLRYCDPNNQDVLADMKKMEYWMPVDVYVGGDEHNTLHLLYSRFIYQFLWDLAVVPKSIPEPYKKRISHGVILGPDGNRMSKSKGNVIVPDEFVEKYGADSLRTYLMFMGPFDATMAWNERSLIGVRRFIEKFYNLIELHAGTGEVTDDESKKVIHQLIKQATEDVAEFKFNTVIARLMETVNTLSKPGFKIGTNDLGSVVKVLALFAPFVAEQLWSDLGEVFSVHNQEWPVYDEKYLLSERVNLSVQVNGKMRGLVSISPDAEEQTVILEVKKSEKINKYLEEGEIRKIIYIRGKTINFVVG